MIRSSDIRKTLATAARYPDFRYIYVYIFIFFLLLLPQQHPRGIPLISSSENS